MLRNLAAALPLSTIVSLAGGRIFPALYVTLLAVIVSPILFDPIPPLTDYINHLARMHVLANLDGDPVLAKFYGVHWAIIPNLIMDILVPPVAAKIGVFAAGQAFLLLTVLLLLTGPMAIHRALWKCWSPWPLLAFPLLYNGIFLVGLVNYLLGLGLALWAVALWIALRKHNPWLRLAVSSGTVFLLFFCHLFAVGLYGMTLTAFELYWLTKRSDANRLVDPLVLLFPFLLILPLIGTSPTLELTRDILWESQGKLEGLYLAVELYRDIVDLAFVGGLIAGGIWIARRNMLGLHPAGWVLFAMSLLVFLALPRQLFGSWLADQRFPVAAIFLLIGFLAPDLRGRLSRAAFYAFLVGITFVRCLEVQINWRDCASITEDMSQAVNSLPKGSTILIARADSPAGGDRLVQALSHLPTLALFGKTLWCLQSSLFRESRSWTLTLPTRILWIARTVTRQPSAN